MMISLLELHPTPETSQNGGMPVNPRRMNSMKVRGILTLLVVAGLPLQIPATASQIRFLGLPGSSGFPQLVAFDSQTAHLFFNHFYHASPDSIGIKSLQRSLIDGIWENVTVAPPPSLVSLYKVRPSFSQHTNFSIIYLSGALQLLRIGKGSESTVLTLLTKEDLQSSATGFGPTNVQAVMDSTNQLHLMWDRYFEIEMLENEFIMAKRGVFYSVFDGENMSPPERVLELEFGTNLTNSPYFDPCGPGYYRCLFSFLAIDPDDCLHLAWFNGATYFMTHTSEGWTEPRRVDTTPYSEKMRIPTDGTVLVQADLPLLDFQIDSTGVLYFFYSVHPENNRLLLVTYHDELFTRWESNMTAALHPFPPMQSFGIERDSTDQFHLISIESPDPDSSRITYQTFKTGFSTPVIISTAGSEVDLAIDTEDQPHIVWRQTVKHEELFYTRLTETGWLPPVQVTNGTEIDHQFGWLLPESSSPTSQPPLPEEFLSAEIFVGILTISVLLATFRRYWSKKRDNL